MFSEAATEIGREWSRLMTRVLETNARLGMLRSAAASEANSAMAGRPPNTAAASRAVEKVRRLDELQRKLNAAHELFQSRITEVHALRVLASDHAARFAQAAKELWDIRSMAERSPLLAGPVANTPRLPNDRVLVGTTGGASALKACASRVGELQSRWKDARAGRSLAVSYRCIKQCREVMLIVERHEQLIEWISGAALYA